MLFEARQQVVSVTCVNVQMYGTVLQISSRRVHVRRQLLNSHLDLVGFFSHSRKGDGKGGKALMSLCRASAIIVVAPPIITIIYVFV